MGFSTLLARRIVRYCIVPWNHGTLTLVKPVEPGRRRIVESRPAWTFVTITSETGPLMREHPTIDPWPLVVPIQLLQFVFFDLGQVSHETSKIHLLVQCSSPALWQQCRRHS